MTTRTKTGAAIDNKLLESLKELSKETRIPQSKLLDEAIELLLEKHGKPIINPAIEPIVVPVVEIKHNPLDDEIEMLNLPPVVFNKIRRHAIYIKDLMKIDCSKIPLMGPKNLKVLNDTLNAYLEKHK
ncbi:ribbon-helix-helix domain-containing protein [Sporosarcina psychrophila]|uniref:ribbon-helix-helix domain-containing protein n=1 Tax=Sporosarcina psychrophila TaxID=1476 RepID=UPI000ADE73FA